MARRTAVFVVVVAMLTSPVVGFVDAGVAAPETITVDDDGEADYASVAAAVGNAQAGDTIDVAPGTYTEAVTVDTPDLTIRGDPGDGAPGAGPDAPVMDGSGVAFTLTGAAGGTTLTGFEVQNGYEDALSVAPGSGTLEGVTVARNTFVDDVDIQAGDGATLRNLRIERNVIEDADLDADAADEASVTVDGLTIRRNEFVGFSDLDLHWANLAALDVDDLTVTRNELPDGDVELDWDDADSLSADGVHVVDNDITDGDVSLDWSGAGVEGESPGPLSATGLRIADNDITDGSVELELGDSGTFTLSDARIESNRVDEGSGDAFDLEMESVGADVTLVVADNEIVGGSSDGMEIEMATDASYDLDITGNLVDGNGNEGIELYDLGGESMAVDISDNEILNNGGSGIRAADDGDVTGITVRRNVISGNEIGIENNDPTAVLDARENYWGASDGPSSYVPELEGGEEVPSSLADPPVRAPDRLHRVPTASGAFAEALQELFLLDPVTDTAADGSGDSVTPAFSAVGSEESAGTLEESPEESDLPPSNVRFDPFLTAPPGGGSGDPTPTPNVVLGPEFVVSEASVDRMDPYTGQPVNVTLRVENRGGGDGTYHLNLFDSDETLRSTDARIEAGDSRTFEFTLQWDETGAVDLQTHRTHVARLQVTERPTPTLDSGAVEVEETAVPRSQVLHGERYVVAARVTNDANRTGRLTVPFAADGSPAANRTVTLGPDETGTVRYTALAGPNGTGAATGPVNWTVANESAGNLTVRRPSNVSTGVVDVFATPWAVAPNESYPVSAVVHNGGSSPELLSVSFRSNASADRSIWFVRLPPGESRTVTLSAVAPSNASAVEWTVGGEESAEVTVAGG